VKKTAGGELTAKQAVGLDWRVAKDSWLNLRYGRRQKSSGSGEEGASLLTLTLGGDLLIKNSRIDSPGWKCTRFIGMAHPLGGYSRRGPALAHHVSLLSFVANQVPR
jgi:hypothetical protein